MVNKGFFKALTDKNTKCRFLLLLSGFTVFLLLILNLYIAYTVIQYFTGDGFAFIGGLFIAFSFIITLPTLFLSIKNVQWLINKEGYKDSISLLFGIVGILSGLILHNVSVLWIPIVIFSLLLLSALYICKYYKNKISNPKKL